MKPLIVTAMLLSLPLAWSFAQTTPNAVSGPVELHNPHRRTSLGGLENTVPQPTQIAASTSPQTSSSSVALYADGPYLFVLRGDSLLQFNKKTLKLLRSVQLPPLPSPSSKSE